MDRVLVDCLISFHNDCINSGGGAYLLTGTLKIYTDDPQVISCMEILLYTTVTFILLCGWMDLFRDLVEWKINCADDTFRNRNSRNENRLDLWNNSDH